MQSMLSGIQEIKDVLAAHSTKKVLLVCDAAFEHLEIAPAIREIVSPYVLFDAFTPNPLYEDVASGVRTFRDSSCDFIVAVGGGSTIDTAKCIKLFGAMDPASNYLEQEYGPHDVPLLAIPTTAGTGSESTRFAVIYYNGEKQSITNNAILPAYVLLEPSVLKTLPPYQKKCAMLDALCQAIESWWSVNSTEESMSLSRRAIRLIMEHMDGHLNGTADGNRAMLTAANLSGRAINLTQTTAAHAMSYKLTSLYNLPHGHAVALCLPRVWEYMLGHTDACSDTRGSAHLQKVFANIAAALGAGDAREALVGFDELLHNLSLTAPTLVRQDDLELLARSVNPVRLKNNPVPIDQEAALELYAAILHRSGGN